MFYNFLNILMFETCECVTYSKKLKKESLLWGEGRGRETTQIMQVVCGFLATKPHSVPLPSFQSLLGDALGGGAREEGGGG